METSLEAGLPWQQRPSKAGSLRKRVTSAIFRILRPQEKAPKTKEGSSNNESNEGTRKGPYSKAENDEACAKMWTIYIGEAERYDAALVESWKADMERMLIFSGLFSASLTAFIIESYKTLQPDSGDLTVAALSKVSQQLAAIAVGGSYALQPAAPFHATTASLLCNALWFISLSLSLICALLATLVEQWAREFLHKTEMRPSPIRRARIFSFLYFGLKRFRMHTVVDVIPFLLHLSLLVFFVGLVAFLLPVNRIMMYLICIALFIFILLYAILTVLPAIYLDCPYRIPLSAPLWSILQHISFKFFRNTHSSSQRTMTEAVVDCALQDTEERDQRALQWTLDSLTDDAELLPFVETIPDIIHGSNGFRRVNDYLFLRVRGDATVASPLVTRISNLLVGTSRLRTDDPFRLRRWNASLKALWALALLPVGWETRFDTNNIKTILQDQSTDPVHNPTVLLALKHHDQMWCRHLLAETRELLHNYKTWTEDDIKKNLPEVGRRMALILQQQEVFFHPTGHERVLPNLFSIPFDGLKRLDLDSKHSLPIASALLNTLHDSPDWITNKVEIVATFLSSAFNFPATVSFEPLTTCDRVLAGLPLTRIVQGPTISRGVHFPNITRVFNPPSFRNGIHNLDLTLRIAFRLLPPFLPVDKNLVHSGLFWYLTHRNNAPAIQYALQDCDKALLSASLVYHLQESAPISEDALHAAVVITSVLPHTEAIKFAEEILATNQDILCASSPLHTIKDIRCLEQFDWDASLLELQLPHCSPSYLNSAHKTLQKMYGHRLLRAYCPQPVLVNPSVLALCSAVTTQIANNYLIILARLLDDCTSPPTGVISTTLFGLLARQRYSTAPIIVWTDIYPETQQQIFSAIKDFIDYLSHPDKPRDPRLFGIAQQLWASGLFWRVDFGDNNRYLNLTGIERQCVEAVVEALRLYADVSGKDPGDGTSIEGVYAKTLLDSFTQNGNT